MKPLKTKAQVRAELEAEISRFQHSGGEVTEVPRGLSGRIDNSNPFAQGFDGKPTEARTPVNNEISALESRKVSSSSKSKRPRRKLIKDDFGEPLRWVWED